jgi:hypothetical protein
MIPRRRNNCGKAGAMADTVPVQGVHSDTNAKECYKNRDAVGCLQITGIVGMYTDLAFVYDVCMIVRFLAFQRWSIEIHDVC